MYRSMTSIRSFDPGKKRTMTMWALQRELVNYSNDRYNQSHFLTKGDCRVIHPGEACISDKKRIKTCWSAGTAASLAWKMSLTLATEDAPDSKAIITGDIVTWY